MAIARWGVLAGLMFGLGLSHAQRGSLPVLGPSLTQDLSLSSSQLATVFAALAFGMVVGFVLMTVVTASTGTRYGLTVGFAGAAMAAVASGLASNGTGLMVSRFALGFFAAALIPAAVQTVAEWFPRPLRPLAIGLILLSTHASFLVTPPLVAILAALSGWRVALVAVGLPGVFIAALCWTLLRSRPLPENPNRLSGASLIWVGTLGVGLLFAASISSLVHVWFPSYLRSLQGVEMAPGPVISTATIAASGGFWGSLLCGGLASALMYTGVRPSKALAFLLTLCAAPLPLVALAGLADTPAAILLLSFLLMVAYYGVVTLMYAAVADTLPAGGVAIAVAVGSLIISLSSVFSPLAIGWGIERGGYNLIFPLAGALGTVVWLLVSLPAWIIEQPSDIASTAPATLADGCNTKDTPQVPVGR